MLVVLSLAAGLAQQATFRSSTRIVPVLTTVIDAQGRLVPNLEQDQFTILDNGKPQEITFFQNDVQPFTVVVILDFSASMTANLDRLKNATEQFLLRMLPADKGQVGAFSDKIQFNGTFTNDRDELGGVVSGASVVARGAGGSAPQTVTGPDGRFSLEVTETAVSLVVRAGGFAEKIQAVSGGGEVEVVLTPAGLFESVTVTATRNEQRLGDVPASVSVVDRETIRRSPAVVADDVLRSVPTFSLFRRTSSLQAHPTAQGVSLRGIGPSGVSRSLVLIDGVPFNDPFGGWVYWTRVPLESVDRIEVVDGTSSSVYGNYAMGGVINVVSARPRPRTAELRAQYGSKSSPKADFSG